MLIAQQKRKENIAEYVLYMWQMEDTLRAYKLDTDAIEKQIVSRYDVADNVKQQIRAWYNDLAEMIRLERVEHEGHLQINKNVVMQLTELHSELLRNPAESDYSSVYYKTLPFIVELRSKNPNKGISELETCFSALYGFLLLRLQQKPVSGETQAAITQISALLRMLSQKWQQRAE